MEFKEMVSLLEEHPFFKELDRTSLEVLAGCGKNVVFRAGEYIFQEDRDADQFFLIKEGIVALELYLPQGHPVVLQTLDAGEILGWSWLVPPYKWTFDARAQEDTRLVAMDAKCLRGKMEEDFVLGYQLLKRFSMVIAFRLQNARMQLLDLYSKDAPGRAVR